MTRFLDLVHPSAGTALMSQWLTGTAERSRTAADTMLGEWASAPAPPGRLAQHIFLAADGSGLLFYAQWSSDEAHLRWARTHRPQLVSRVDALVPGIERPGLTRTRLADSLVHDATRPAGLLVVSTAAHEGNDTAVLTAGMPLSGLLATYVHHTQDGEQTIRITEWGHARDYEAPRTTGPGRQYTLYGGVVDEDGAAGLTLPLRQA